jgi:hypothetical protein
MPKELLIGVNSTGMLIFQRNKKDPMTNFPFTELSSWRCEFVEEKVFLHFDVDSKQRKHFVFACSKAPHVIELLEFYVKPSFGL